MLSLKDFNFDYSTEDGFDKACDIIKQAILNEETISAELWRWIYYADAVCIVDERTHLDEIDSGYVPTNVYIIVEGNKYFTFWYDQSLIEGKLNKFYDLVAVPVHRVMKTIEVWEEGE